MADQDALHVSNGASPSASQIEENAKQLEDKDQGKGEAICFTAGLEGAPFGAGVIHAYLASDRKPPSVVAGISMGALTSAAFQRAYRELKAPGEDARWRWYRRYLGAISEKPLDVIWSGIPDQSDFFAEFNPVQDPAPATIPDANLKKELVEAEKRARRDLTLFVKLGHWVSRLPVKVGAVADVVVKFVRVKEGYGYSFALWRYLTFFFSLLPVILRPLIHNAFHPQFIHEADFEPKSKKPGTALLIALMSFVPTWILIGLLLTLNNKLAVLLWGLSASALLGTVCYGYLSSKRPRPLLGWPLYSASVTFTLGLLLAGVWALVVLCNFAVKWFPPAPADPAHPEVASYPNFTGFLQDLNSVLLPGARLGMKVLFLIAFVSTAVSAIHLIRNNAGTHKREPGKKARWIKAMTSFWALRLVRWTAYSLGFLILGFSILAATVPPFRGLVAGLAKIEWVQHIIVAIIRFNDFMIGAVLMAVDLRYWIISICAFLLAVFIVKKGQRLSQSELDAVASARSRRRPKFFAWNLRAKVTYSTWVAWLFFLSAQVMIMAIHFTGWTRGLLLASLGISVCLWIQIAWQTHGLRWGLKARKWVDFMANVLFGNLNLHKALVHNYYLRLALYDLFRETDEGTKKDNQEPVLRVDPFPVVLVAAPLQVTKSKNDKLDSYQIWAAQEASLIDVLTGALAVPGLYEPGPVARNGSEANADHKSDNRQGVRKKTGRDAWCLPQESTAATAEFDVVDGTVIRQNPIPPFFTFVSQDPKDTKDQNLASALRSTKDCPRVHIVYSVPIDPALKSEREVNASIVDVGLAAAKLSRRRDTQLEVHQSNLLSQVAAQLDKLGANTSGLSPIFADEIAPQSDAGYKNPLSPTRDEVLERIASGCRATLEVVYADELVKIAAASGQFTPCSELMNRVSGRKEFQVNDPGLPEVCAACRKSSKSLLRLPRRKADGRADLKPLNTWSSLLDDNTHCKTWPHLNGEQPRIVFVASGGVFRGTFHAGMVAALLAARIKPDLIVGASVGTIMGGALAAAFSTDNYGNAIRHLEKLTEVLLNVDHQIAFTKPFKNAVRDLGIRARDVTISPNDVRKMVLDGSREDAAFGVVGAPSALIDNISHLLLIPHKKTAEIVSEFIAGHVTQATKILLDQLKKETLKRLKIEYAVMGTSLIHPAAQKLLTTDGLDMAKLQPFKTREIAVYGTTIDYWRQRPVLLGAGKDERTYDFIEAALCSSAFPCVFSARRESDLYPGTGDPATLFCDGGMFDNLPFLPAAEILSKVQFSKIEEDKKNLGRSAVDVSMDALARRCQRPDLFIAGSLDVNLQRQHDLDNTFQNIAQIMERASALQNNVKIKGYEQMLLTLDYQLRTLLAHEKKHPKRAELDFDLLDGLVNAAVLPVYPIDPQHLNGTFAFCASTGMKQGRLKDSIADGCFQTLRAFANPASSTCAGLQDKAKPLVARSIAGLKDCGKLPEVAWIRERQKETFEVAVRRRGSDPLERQEDRCVVQGTVISVWRYGDCKFFRLPQDQDKDKDENNWFKPGDAKTMQPFQCPFYLAAKQLRTGGAGKDGKSAADPESRQRALQMQDIYDRCITDEAHIRVYRETQQSSREEQDEPAITETPAPTRKFEEEVA